MGRKFRVTAIHERDRGFIGVIEDEAVYEGVKAGVLNWKPHIKAKLESIQIPAALFYRLMELDRSRSQATEL